MLRSKTRNQIADQAADIREEMDEMAGGEIVLMDGQIAMRDKKLSPKDHTDLEVVVGDGLEIAIQSGKMKFQHSARAVLNSVKVGQALKEVQLEKLMLSADNQYGNKTLKDDDNISNKSFNSLKKPSSRSSFSNGDEKKFSSKEDLMGSQDELDRNAALVDGAAEDIDADKMETATADVIINEYPSDCFPDNFYSLCPCCLEETPFLLWWKDIRFRSYQFVEHKYFETLVITLILISSMALVRNMQFPVTLFARKLMLGDSYNIYM